MDDLTQFLTTQSILSDPSVFKALQQVIGIRYTTTKPTYTPNKEVDVWIYFNGSNYFLEIWANGAWREQQIGQTLANPIFKNGTTTYPGNSASGTQTIAHGLGKIPTFTRITALNAGGTPFLYQSFGAYDGTSQNNVNSSITVSVGGSANSDPGEIIFISDGSGNRQAATIAVDATNITLTWTKLGSGVANNINLLWEVYG